MNDVAVEEGKHVFLNYFSSLHSRLCGYEFTDSLSVGVHVAYLI